MMNGTLGKPFNPHKWPAFDIETVYNSSSEETFNWDEIRTLYETYFIYKRLPINIDIYTSDEDKVVALHFAMACEARLIDWKKLIKKIERYSKWNEFTRMLLKSMSSHSNIR